MLRELPQLNGQDRKEHRAPVLLVRLLAGPAFPHPCAGKRKALHAKILFQKIKIPHLLWHLLLLIPVFSEGESSIVDSAAAV